MIFFNNLIKIFSYEIIFVFNLRFGLGIFNFSLSNLNNEIKSIKLKLV